MSAPTNPETVFTYGSPQLKFGPGAAGEIGLSHARLRPALAVIDPDLVMTQPSGVTACAGMDIVCHALESYTARWFASYDRKRPEQRVPYCGANPVSDMWSRQALELLAGAGKQQRLLATCPRPVTPDDLAAIFRASMELW